MERQTHQAIGRAMRFGFGATIIVASVLLTNTRALAQHPADYWLFSTTDGGTICWEVPIATEIKNDSGQFKGKGP